MEMHQVRYFLAVAEELNFTRAAERCNVAQPSLTRAIKLLEGELGGPLFNRERANTHLSELGRMVKPYLEQVYEQTREAKRQALDFVKLKKTILKLGVMCTIAPDQLVDLVCAVQSRKPRHRAGDHRFERREARGAADRGRARGGDLLPGGQPEGRATALYAALPRAVPGRAPSRAPARGQERHQAGRPQWPALPQPHQLRVQRLCRRVVEGAWAHLRDRIPQRARRLDPGNGRERPRLRLHAGKLRQPPAGDRAADDRPRVLA